ncbi:MAG: 4a-hydroxytetrahydrobiopterin dehydratase [Proteobacteria bacterium]|nr:4a-hydroxytetrahydrobiopterin dehydratase [Pseudomonadota bacterium]
MKNSTNSTCSLADQKCVPCEGGVPVLQGKNLNKIFEELGNGWHLVEEHHIEKSYSFKNFLDALNFTNRVGELSEAEGHHPEICLGWGKVKIEIWTHAVGGLTDNDFILAAKIGKIA